MSIEIKNGFLKLTGIAKQKSTIWIKGSVITSVETLESFSPERTAITSSTATLIVLETCDAILEAIAESYKQAARR